MLSFVNMSAFLPIDYEQSLDMLMYSVVQTGHTSLSVAMGFSLLSYVGSMTSARSSPYLSSNAQFCQHVGIFTYRL